ncbi:hypothetical protein AALP_AA8G352300 [Arabis alpina]|uniref:F-box domain-containing protein n=1 Tax=Arabis alpina TaxID=50452 RepID=A0A087GBG1_ARAAL|nr:hypothetical protein AALP_AA8G352300 [Arabis alpina]
MDRISNLSDDLLLKILSSLPTKDIVETMFLSKRWKFLWTMVPKLDFDDGCLTDYNDDEDEYTKFLQYVDRLMVLHKPPVLETLKFTIGYLSSIEDMATWIRVAIVRRVRELEINRHHPQDLDSFTLPRCLFTYEKLVVLKLRRSIFLDLPLELEVWLPSLKTLHLLSVKHENEASHRNLLAGCPVLEELVVDKTFNDPVPSFYVIVPSLKRLSIIEQDCNEESTEESPVVYNNRVLIDVPSLKYLDYVDVYDFGHVCSSKNMPELVEANVKLVSKSPGKLMRSITSVKRLSLCLYGSVLKHNIVFYQLVHLELCGCSSKWWDLLTWMLERSPKLQVLKLNNCVERSFCLVKPIEVFWRQPRSVPECLMCHLSTFEWKYYTGIHEEKELVAYILRNAKRLKTAQISATALGLDSEGGPRKLKELASLHRASKSCQLLLIC